MIMQDEKLSFMAANSHYKFRIFDSGINYYFVTELAIFAYSNN
jgi:hypothetical protein